MDDSMEMTEMDQPNQAERSTARTAQAIGVQRVGKTTLLKFREEMLIALESPCEKSGRPVARSRWLPRS
jgi:hypothetical protein